MCRDIYVAQPKKLINVSLASFDGPVEVFRNGVLDSGVVLDAVLGFTKEALKSLGEFVELSNFARLAFPCMAVACYFLAQRYGERDGTQDSASQIRHVRSD